MNDQINYCQVAAKPAG